MQHKFEIEYRNRKIDFNTGYIQGLAGEEIEFVYLGDSRATKAKLKFERADSPGTPFAPFTQGGSSMTLVANAETPVKRTLINEGVVVKYSVKLDYHTIDPIIIIIPVLRRLKARIDAINSFDGVIQLLGVSVLTDDETEFIDDITCAPRFGFDDLRVGDYVEVTAYDNGARQLSPATSVISLPPNQLSAVEGPVCNVQAREFRVAGVTVRVNGDTQLFVASGKLVSLRDFFDQLEDAHVLVCGNWNADAGRLIAVNATLLE